MNETIDTPLHRAGLRSGTALIASLAIGAALWFVLRLHPVWWMAWIAPAALLALALRLSDVQARWLVTLSAFVALAPLVPYFVIVAPWPVAIVPVALLTLLWRTTILFARRMILRHRSAWTVFVLPLGWVTADTLMARFLPDGNWASAAYTQSEFLPMIQLTSVTGVSGVLFLLMLWASALAVRVVMRRDVRYSGRALAGVTVLIVVVLGFGAQRLRQQPAGDRVTYGLVAIDDAIGLKATAEYSARIRAQYDTHIASLAASGAEVVVLPEKVAFLSDVQGVEWGAHFSTLAERNHVWLEVGVAIDSAGGRRNYSYLFRPDGGLAARYHKHYMAPPERTDVAGNVFVVQPIATRQYGLAICKDMHFAALGRAYGERAADAMLVPAWDFDRDAWMGARMTVVRGVENGYVVVRSAREGLLTVSDAYGRIIAERRSAAMPGVTMLVTTTVPRRVPTTYARVGDVFAWGCVVGFAAVLLTAGRRKNVRSVVVG